MESWSYDLMVGFGIATGFLAWDIIDWFIQRAIAAHKEKQV